MAAFTSASLPNLRRRHQLLPSTTAATKTPHSSTAAATKNPTLFPSLSIHQKLHFPAQQPLLRLRSPSPAAQKFKAAGDDRKVPILQLGGDVRLMTDRAEGELVRKEEKDGVKIDLTMISLFHDLSLNTHVLVGVAFFLYVILGRDALFAIAKRAWLLIVSIWAKRPNIWAFLTAIWAKFSGWARGK